MPNRHCLIWRCHTRQKGWELAQFTETNPEQNHAKYTHAAKHSLCLYNTLLEECIVLNCKQPIWLCIREIKKKTMHCTCSSIAYVKTSTHLRCFKVKGAFKDMYIELNTPYSSSMQPLSEADIKSHLPQSPRLTGGIRLSLFLRSRENYPTWLWAKKNVKYFNYFELVLIPKCYLLQL